ncbi:transcriptional regulator SplA domain-containing protein [Mesobacillus zeae]|uniref:Transcriptional regulator n=1 Tax=Mesobacillus zeae TaxID=1917180 RepID=A0A398B6N4_9BACI|nr:transcriptional regulator SplA domain-containing protein [Mesobacillus zeae]RID85605.1 transcriptional regulator [Mesobacillus zeae]
MDTIKPDDLDCGDEVFVIYHNPHVPTVATVKAAEVVTHPKNPDALALFINETFHVIEEDDAFFASEQAAQSAYDETLGGSPEN